MKIIPSFGFNAIHNRAKQNKPAFSGNSAKEIMPPSNGIQVINVKRLHDPAGNNPDRKVLRTGRKTIVYVFDYTV